MNLALKRLRYELYGITGILSDENGEPICVTLEHSYGNGANSFIPKLAPGVYTCQRGMHELEHGIPFETFEVMNVPPFRELPVTGILLHVGNYNSNSEGCILLGTYLGTGCILESAVAFTKFINLQAGVDTFTLTVS